MSWARDVATKYVSDGSDIKEAIVKVAHDNTLSQEEIKILSGNVNKMLTVQMNQKVASKILPLGATVPMTSHGEIMESVRKRALAKEAAVPTPPPPMDVKKRLFNKAASAPQAAPQLPSYVPSVEDILNEPLLTQVCGDVDTLIAVREQARQEIISTRAKLATLTRDSRSLIGTIDRNLSELVVVKQASVADLQVALMGFDTARDVLTKRAAEYNWKPGVRSTNTSVNTDHPLMKAAADVARLDTSIQVLSTHQKRLETLVDVTNHRIVELTRSST